MKLTDLEKTILFDALTLYKKVNNLWRTYTPEQKAEAEAVSSLRSKLKKAMDKS